MTHLVHDPSQAAASLEGLAWIAVEAHDARRATVLMAAADTLGRTVGASTVLLPHLVVFHEACERSARGALEAEEFEAAHLEGGALSFDEAVTYVMQETT